MKNNNFVLVDNYLSDVENYKKRHEISELWLTDELKNIKDKAVKLDKQDDAKKAWCYKTIHKIQQIYLKAFFAMKEERFYDGWCLLEQVEISIHSLEKHFPFSSDDDYKIHFIDKQVTQFQTLYPYTLFISPAFLHLDKECSICGAKISIRNFCGHKKGEIYNGEMCVHKINNIEPLEVSIVSNPVQKYSVLFLSDSETGEQIDQYDYELLTHVTQ